jgi:DNA replicative helicase MCM subunit Mcm2 (Cdc46/Mcm family)
VDPKKATDKQIIVLQDGPLTLSCIISGKKDMMWRVKPGQKAYAIGVLKFEPVYNKTTHRQEMHPFLDLLYIEPSDNQEIEITQADIVKFKEEMVKHPLFKQNLLESVAPHIKGNDALKEVAIYVIASQQTMRPNNGLFLGRPGTGKSQILKWFSKVSTKGVMQSFGRVSIPGLTSATVTDEHTGQKINKPGLFASYWFAALNELQAIQDKKDIKISLNDVLDRKEVTQAMVGGDYNIEARCAILMDSNNFMGQWDPKMRLAENLKFLEPNIGPFLSRMDLIAEVVDDRTDEEEDEISGKVFDSYDETDDAISKYMDDWETPEGLPRYGFNTLRKFFYYVSQQPEAKVSPELKTEFVKNCKLARKHDFDLLLDGRYEETVMRQTRIGGRLMLKDVAGKDELDEAFRLVNRSRRIVVETTLIDGTVEKDGNIYNGNHSKATMAADMDQETLFEMACNEVIKESKREWFEAYQISNQLTQNMQARGWNEMRVNKMIDKWLKVGKLMYHGAEGGGRYKFVNKPRTLLDDE